LQLSSYPISETNLLVSIIIGGEFVEMTDINAIGMPANDFETQVAAYKQAMREINTEQQASTKVKEATALSLRKAFLKLAFWCGVLCLFPFGVFLAVPLFVLGSLAVLGMLKKDTNPKSATTAVMKQNKTGKPQAHADAYNHQSVEVESKVGNNFGLKETAAALPRPNYQTYGSPPKYRKTKKVLKWLTWGSVGFIVLSLGVSELHWLSLTPEQQVAETTMKAKVKADRAAKATEDAILKQDQATQQEEFLKQQAERKTASAQESDAKTKLSALDKMALVFKGGYTKDQIELEAATVLRLFDQSLSDTNYERLGGALVALSDGIKPNTEMDILICMKTLKRDSGNVKMDIPFAAALCATSISAGL
jgi:hypothetical protein